MSIRYALLALLSERPKYGMQLRQEFESKTGEVWPLNVGQVYLTLQRLERDGAVESDSEESGSRRRFRITPAGEQELATWLRTPPDTASPPRDELMIKVLVALTLPGVDVREVLQVHRRHLIEAMQRYTHLKSEAPEDELALAIVVDAEVFRLEAVVRWLDGTDARLARGAAIVTRVEPAASTEPRSRQEVNR